MAPIAVTLAITSLFWSLILLSFVADIAAEFNCSELNTLGVGKSLDKFPLQFSFFDPALSEPRQPG